MKTLVLANQKGGVGKSAIGCQLAYYLHEQNKRVLFVDLDHQSNSTKALKTSKLATVSSLSSTQILSAVETEIEKQAFVLVPADESLLKFEKQGDLHNAFATHFSNFIKSASAHFDVCLIDTNPNPDVRLIAGMVTADFVLSPIELNQEAIDGIGYLLGLIMKVQKVNPKLALMGILPNRVEPTPFQKANFMDLVQYFSGSLIALGEDTSKFAFIPTRTAIAEAQAQGVPIWKLSKTSAKEAWREIKPSFVEITRRIGV